MQVNREHHDSLRDALGNHELSELRPVKAGDDLSNTWPHIRAGADEIERTKPAYRIEDQNSNTFASTVLIGAGILPQEFERFPTPGSGRFLTPSGRNERLDPVALRHLQFDGE